MLTLLLAQASTPVLVQPAQPVVVQLMTPILALVSVMFTGIMAYLMAKLNHDQAARAVEAGRKLDTVAGHAADVKTTLEATTRVTDAKLDEIHTLVNKRYGEALLATLLAMKELARLHGTSENIANVAKAERDYEEHQALQGEADAQMAVALPPPPIDSKP